MSTLRRRYKVKTYLVISQSIIPSWVRLRLRFSSTQRFNNVKLISVQKVFKWLGCARFGWISYSIHWGIKHFIIRNLVNRRIFWLNRSWIEAYKYYNVKRPVIGRKFPFRKQNTPTSTSGRSSLRWWEGLERRHKKKKRPTTEFSNWSLSRNLIRGWLRWHFPAIFISNFNLHKLLHSVYIFKIKGPMEWQNPPAHRAFSRPSHFWREKHPRLNDVIIYF